MIINTNVAALNTFNALNKNTSAMNQALSELSTGKKINSAADDPSGLTISEQMQGQINGLNQANSNTQNGISLLQTAQGGLSETSSILQSMRELAVQASNGTNTTTDLQAIQDQINQYTSEISAIGNTTQFNTMNVLKGGTPTGAVTPVTAGTAGVTAAAAQAGVWTVNVANIQNNDIITIDSTTLKATTGTASAGEFAIGTTAADTASNLAAAITADGSTTPTVAAAANVNGAGVVTLTQTPTKESPTSPITLPSTDFAINNLTAGVAKVIGVQGTDTFTVSNNFAAGDLVNFNGTQFTAVTGSATGNEFTIGADTGATAANLANVITKASGDTGYTASAAAGLITVTQTTGNESPATPTVTVATPFATNLQVGANQDQTMAVSINDMRSAALDVAGQESAANAGGVTGAYFTGGTGVNALSDYTTNGEAALDVTSQSKATSAITVIDNAINTVSNQNSLLGSYQERLQDTSDNLTTSSQNITSANSTLVNVDMASEMSQYTQDSILVQAATSMLAQANQEPQTVLKLLQ
jgi:flagellin